MNESQSARLAAIRTANAQRQADTTSAPAVLDTPGTQTSDKAARLAAIRAANAQRQAGETTVPAALEGVTETTRSVPMTDTTARLAAAPVAIPEATALNVPSLGLILLAAMGGAFFAIFALPTWLPGLSASLLGSEPKVYWYLARSTAFIAYGLLWLSMALGLMMTNKLARLWPSGPVAFDLHQHASILGLAFGVFHALILLGDSYSNYTLGQILIPFASAGYKPLWVGLGQISLYLMGLVGLSFYVRPLIGRAGWRLIHFLSFAIFGMVLLHGVQSGSDTGTVWAQGLYWLSGASLVFLTVYRVLVSVTKPTSTVRPAHERISAA